MDDSLLGRVAEIKRHHGLVGFVIRLAKEKSPGVMGGLITLLLLFTGILAGSLSPL